MYADTYFFFIPPNSNTKRTRYLLLKAYSFSKNK